jgi:hypothetical protein
LEVTYEQISGAPKSLLLLLSRIERSAREEGARANGGVVPKSAHGIAAVLNAWEESVIAKQEAGCLRVPAARLLRAKLQDHLEIRNGICHGLDGVSSAYDGMPAMLTWSINGGKNSITWDDLQTSFSWLSRASRAIGTISSASSVSIGNRMSDNPDNRGWWLIEFGLDLPKQS